MYIQNPKASEKTFLLLGGSIKDLWLQDKKKLSKNAF